MGAGVTPVAVVSLGDIATALAGQIEAGLADAVPGLQVSGRLNPNPTPPSIDILPGSPFLTPTAFAVESYEALFRVRARVTTADNEAGQDLLYDLLDPRGDRSVAAVIAADPSLGSSVSSAVVEASEFIVYDQAGGGSLLGAEWRVMVEL